MKYTVQNLECLFEQRVLEATTEDAARVEAAAFAEKENFQGYVIHFDDGQGSKGTIEP